MQSSEYSLLCLVGNITALSATVQLNNLRAVDSQGAGWPCMWSPNGTVSPQRCVTSTDI